MLQIVLFKKGFCFVLLKKEIIFIKRETIRFKFRFTVGILIIVEFKEFEIVCLLSSGFVIFNSGISVEPNATYIVVSSLRLIGPIYYDILNKLLYRNILFVIITMYL